MSVWLMAMAASKVAEPFPVSITSPRTLPDVEVLSIMVIESTSTLFVSAAVTVRSNWFPVAVELVRTRFSEAARVKFTSELNVAAPLRVSPVSVPREVMFPCDAWVVAVSGASPVMVDTVAAFPVMEPAMALVTCKSVNHPLVTLEPVEAMEPVSVREFVPNAKLPPDTVNPPVAVATVMFVEPLKDTPPIVRAV